MEASGICAEGGLEVDRHRYTESVLAEDSELGRIRRSAEERGMPQISVPPELGRLLEILVRGFGARRVLEIGALAGYSGLCLARGLGDEGEIISLELNSAYRPPGTAEHRACRTRREGPT
ncbi:O-methyltransferase family protein, partial [mine drainage metagenome]